MVFFDLQNLKIICRSSDRRHVLFQRLVIQEFSIIDAHMYFGDVVIKFNYRLMREDNNLPLRTTAITYTNVLGLKSDEIVSKYKPMDSVKYNRLLYTTLNKGGFSPLQVSILPYLHERRVYLGSSNSGETGIDCPDLFCKQMHRTTVTSILDPDYPRRTWVARSNSTRPIFVESETEFIEVNLTDQEYTIYSKNGLIKKN